MIEFFRLEFLGAIKRKKMPSTSNVKQKLSIIVEQNNMSKKK